VRDGFITFVFPLLLRRRDIRVNVYARQRRVVTSDLRLTLEPVAGLVADAPEVNKNNNNKFCF
jgi:hypothetical protein